MHHVESKKNTDAFFAKTISGLPVSRFENVRTWVQALGVEVWVEGPVWMHTECLDITAVPCL